MSTNQNALTPDQIRSAVRAHYASAAATSTGCCGAGSTCCGPDDATKLATEIGYDPADLATLPEGANLGLSCGNPHGIASLQPGETVIDLGSGAGFDAFLAARSVGPTGRVIGVDFTPEMIEKSRSAAATDPLLAQVTDFRLGEIEALPIADATVDVALSNCVINLSPDKPRVIRELHRVLKPGGRIAFSDVIATAPIPEDVAGDLGLICGCLGAASTVEEWTAMLTAAGFEDIRITPKEETREVVASFAGDTPGVADIFRSADIHARRP